MAKPYISPNTRINDRLNFGAAGLQALGTSLENLQDQIAVDNSGNIPASTMISGSSWSDVLNNGNLNDGLQNIKNNMLNYSDMFNNENIKDISTGNDLQHEVNYTQGNPWGAMLKDAGVGASAGSVFGPVGALVGGGLGAVSGWVRSAIADRQHKQNAYLGNLAIDRANNYTINSRNNAIALNDERQIRNNMRNVFQDGGDLGNGVTMFNTGSTHQQNPYGGIPQGIASDGLPNRVEENELKYDDYIYSARLKASKKLLKDHLLPEKYEGLPFAEIGKKLQKESEDRPNDPVSRSTLETWMSRLRDAQEEYKAKLEERRLAKVINNLSTEEKAALASSMMQQMQQPQYGMEQLGQIPQQSMQEVPQEVRNSAHWGQEGIDLSIPLVPWRQPFNTNTTIPTSDSDVIIPNVYTENDISKAILNALNYTNADEFNQWAAWHGLNNLDWNNLKDNQTFLNALRIDNPSMADVISRGYNFLPANNNIPETILNFNQSGNWTHNSGKGWLGSNDAAYLQAIEGLTEDEIKNLSPSQLAEKMRKTDAYKKGTEWLKNPDNALLYLSTVEENPNQPESAKDFALNYIEKDSNGNWKWKDNYTYDYNTSIRKKREDNLPGTYWYTPTPALMNNVNKNFIIRNDGTVEEVTDIDKTWTKDNSYNWGDNKGNYTYNYYREPALTSKEEDNNTEEESKVKPIEVEPIEDNWLRYAPLLGGLAGLFNRPDYTLANELTDVASNFQPISAPPLSGWRRYNSDDINLTNNQNMAQLAAAQRANVASGNRDAQAAGMIGLHNAYNQQSALNNLAWQQANERNRLDTDTYNLGIDKTNLATVEAYDQLNQQILDNRANLLAKAAEARDASNTAWSTATSNNLTNSLNNLGALGKENWNRSQRDALIQLLGNDTLKQLLGIKLS